MDLRFFDLSLTPIGLVDECKSLMWSIKYFDTGEVKILAPMTDNNIKCMQTGSIVTLHNGYIELEDETGVWRRGALITSMKLSKDEHGMEQIEARGYALSKYFDGRLLYPTISVDGTTIRLTTPDGTMSSKWGSGVLGAAKYLCYASFIDPTDDSTYAGTHSMAARKVENMIMIDTPETGGDNLFKSWATEGIKTLGDWMHDACTDAKIGYDILVNERTKEFGIYIYRGNDLSRDNTAGNPPCVFSRGNDTIMESEYSDSIGSMKTAEYVFNDNGTAWAEDTATGLERVETYRKTDNLKIDEGEVVSWEEIAENLRKKGLTDLASLTRTYTFDSTINPRASLQYKMDFSLGDRVTCIDSKWGVMINSRITCIEFTYEAGKSEITATFGESSPTLLQAIKRLR